MTTRALLAKIFIGGVIIAPAWAQNVGVGTTTPAAKLHIEVPTGFTNPLLQVNVQGSTPYFIVLPDGKIGIGVATPAELLDVAGNIQFSGSLMPGGNAGTAGQVLVSQGPGVAPQWQDATTIGGDNWGSQVAVTQAPIVGDGTSGNPITIQAGTNIGDILIWDGTQWQIQQPGPSSGLTPLCNTIANGFVTKWTGVDLCNSIIYDDGTNVGIGTTTPAAKLDVNGTVRIRTINTVSSATPNDKLLIANNSGDVLAIQFTGNNSDYLRGDGTWGAISGGDNWGTQVAITQNPIVGDGTTLNPITLQSGNTAGDILVWDGSQWQIQQPGASSGITPICNSPTANFLQKWTGVDLCNSIVYDDGTNVGIGTTTPAFKLDVQGTGRFTGTLTIGAYTLPNVDGTSGQVLTTDGAGNVSWQNVPGDNWGTQTAVTSGPIVGNGTSGSPITFAAGTATGNIWQWDGTAWQQVSPPWDSVCATATANYVMKWTGTELCNTIIQDNGSAVGVNSSPTTNDILYVYRPSSVIGAGKSTIYGYRAGASGAANGGTSWTNSGVDAAVKGYTLWGNEHSAGVAAFSFLDYDNSTAFVAGRYNGDALALLGYRDSLTSSALWGAGITGIDYWSLFTHGNIIVNTAAKKCLLWTEDSILNVGSCNYWTHSGDGTTIAGTTVDYVADFDNGDPEGTAIGVGSIEFLLDGLAETTINNDFSPSTNNTYDLGSATLGWANVNAYNFNTLSDMRLKTDVSELSYGLREIMKIKPIKYRYKTYPFPDSLEVYSLGVSAQELYQIIPEAVRTYRWKKSEKDLKFYKQDLEYWSVDYTKLVPVLIKAIQEQQMMIEKLQRELEQLKGQE